VNYDGIHFYINKHTFFPLKNTRQTGFSTHKEAEKLKILKRGENFREVTMAKKPNVKIL
jgi:hypothetical protein